MKASNDRFQPVTKFVFHYGVRRGPWHERDAEGRLVKLHDGPHHIAEMHGDVLHLSSRMVEFEKHSTLCGLNATGHSRCTCKVAA